MTQLLDLINRASEAEGSDYKLAQRLHVPRQMVSMWRAGTKPCPPEDQAQIAAIAGIDPVQTLIRAHLERHEGTAKGERLFTLLGKRLHQTGAASVLLIGNLALISTMAAKAHFIRCILC